MHVALGVLSFQHVDARTPRLRRHVEISCARYTPRFRSDVCYSTCQRLSAFLQRKFLRVVYDQMRRASITRNAAGKQIFTSFGD